MKTWVKTIVYDEWLSSQQSPSLGVMKQTSFILYMIISGKQMVENDIDVYLKPLISKLKELIVWSCNYYLYTKYYDI